MPVGTAKLLAAALFFCVLSAGFGAQAGRIELRGHVPPVVARLTPLGRVPSTNGLSLAIGLPLRDQAGLSEFIRQLYDPSSTNFHKFITPPEFARRFGPTSQDYQEVIAFAQTNGLSVVETFSNRLVLSVAGRAGDIEQAFQVKLQTFRHPTEPRDFYAPDREPSVPPGLRVISIEGLDDFSRPRHTAVVMKAAKARPLNFNGSGPDQQYMGSDFRNAYAPGSPLNGAGQTVAVLEYSDYFHVDITNYENIVGAVVGVTNYVPLSTVLVGGSTPGTANNLEVALDIEMAISMAPKLSQVLVYEKNSVSSSLLNKIATDNLARQVSSSWLVGNWSSSLASTYDNILQNMAAQGQSYFQSAGDSDAYTGTQSLDNGTTEPADSPYATIVGGTTLTMNGTGASWNSETVWNYNNNGANTIPNEGSGGGISSYYSLPSWQAGISMASNGGSTANRNIPDVALTADDIFISYNDGDFNGSSYAIGTSAAAPLWAGFCALVNQQAAASGGTAPGFLNPALYSLAGTTNYTNYFHDVATGNNIGTNTPGLYYATNGYDLATGLGSPTGTNLINALSPLAQPFIITQPAGQNVTNGVNVVFSAGALGAAPLNYQWLLNGTNLPGGGSFSGVNGNILTITGATTNNAGSYSLVLSNAYNSITSSVAVLNVGFAPVVLTQPTNLTLLAGSTAVFSAIAGGSTNLAYQWKKNGTNLVSGAGISGATTNVLTLTSIATNSAANYTLAVTNIFGAVTSSVAALTVVLPASITSSSLTNSTLQCGSNISYSISASGTAPLSVQWSVGGTPVAGATNSTLSLTNVHQPGFTVAVTVTNLYASATSNATLTVVDTLPPVITLNGSSRMTNQIGSPFVDPGATAYDLCAGAVPVTTNGVVNVNMVGTNTLTYTATDGNGNTNTATRTVVEIDAMTPTILWSFTNLIVSLGSNCTAIMTNVTGTNFIIATNLSGSLVISQMPTNGASLTLGTNVVVIAVADVYGTTVYSTNQIVAHDTALPVIATAPQSQTNYVGTTASFSVIATACTPVAYRWLFGGAILAAQTNISLTLSNLTLGNGGNYSVAATSAGGSVTSAVAVLTVNRLPASLGLASSLNPDGFKYNLVFNAAVTPTNASGTVQFFTNGAAFDLEPLVAGSAASTNIATLPRGTNLIAAIYSGDANYLPATNSLEQAVTNHPPVVSPVSYPLIAGLTLTIPVTNLAAYWSDADGDTLFISAISPSTNGVIITNTTPNLFYADTNYVNDQFVCTISDGFGGSNFQAVSILIMPQTNNTPYVAGVASQPSGLILTLDGGDGSTYILESATNITSGGWLPIATNTLGITGVWRFTDTQATNFPNRFYRLELVP